MVRLWSSDEDPRGLVDFIPHRLMLDAIQSIWEGITTAYDIRQYENETRNRATQTITMHTAALQTIYLTSKTQAHAKNQTMCSKTLYTIQNYKRVRET